MRLLTAASISIVVGCAAAPPPAPAAATAKNPGISSPSGPPAAPGSKLEPETAAAASPERTVAEADGIYRDQLAVPGRDARFSTDRQVAALKRAIALYEMFLSRAGDDPRYEDAKKRSRDRIVDARQTIEFLLSQADGEGR